MIMNNLPLVNIHNHGKTVYLFLRGEDKKLRITPVYDFYPYFYEVDSTGTYKSYDGKRLIRINCNLPSEVRKRRSDNSYESDILFFKRFMIDKIDDLKECPIKWCLEDTEIIAPELPKAEKPIYPISCISVYNNFTEEIKTWFLSDYKGEASQKEKSLLQDFVNYMLAESFDMWLSYNVDFDYNYISARYELLFHRHFAEQISPISQSRYGKRGIFYPIGISIVDYLNWFKKVYNYSQRKRLKSFALDYVAQQLLNEKAFKKVDFSFLSPGIKEKNINDIRRMVKLEKEFKIIPYYDALRRMGKVCWEDLVWNSRIIEAQLLGEAKRQGVVLPKKSIDIEDSEYEGAYREAFELGRFTNEITKYDLTSAYPTMIKEFCIDSSNIGTEGIEIEGSKFKQNSQALLPVVIQKFMEKKSEFKKLKKSVDPSRPEYEDVNRKYEAIKSVVNSCYGVFGNRYFRIYDKRIASATTFLVRDLLYYVKDKLKEKGYELIYTDTDSVFIKSKENISEYLNNLIQQWAKEKYGKDKINLTFEYEGIFEKLFIVALCHYKGWLRTPKGELKEEIKGLEVKRISSTEYEAKFQNELLERPMDNQPREEVVEWIKNEINNLSDKPLEEIAMPAKLARDVRDYKTYLVRKSKDKDTGKVIEKKFDKKLPIFIRALQNSPLKKRVGELFWWVYVKGENQIMAFDEIHKDHIEEIDWQKMIDRNILNKVKPVFEALKWDLGDLISEKPKKRGKRAKKALKSCVEEPTSEEKNQDRGQDIPKIEESEHNLTQVIDNKGVKNKSLNRILIIDIDSKIPNLALKKIEKFHSDKGDKVIWNDTSFKNKVDKIYVSCIFDWNKDKCKKWENTAEIGGSGYDLYKKLPSEIEIVKPKINYGFTTRGCIRNCYYCIVPRKEGKIYVEGDIYDIWDGKSKQLTIMDNNILALPEHFKLIASQLTKEKLKVDFNQGLDHRLLTPEITKILLSLKYFQKIRFAYDDIRYKPTVLKALQMLNEAGLQDWKSRWYVYVSEKDTWETVFERIMLLKEYKQDAYLMRDRKISKKKQWIALACWVNSVTGAFKIATFWDVLKKSERMKCYLPYFNINLKKPHKDME